MTATFFLVRHGAHDVIGKRLVGRMAGTGLNREGHHQAAALARHFSGTALDSVQSSPRDRTLQTATAIAVACALDCETAQGLDEIDFGAWSGRPFEDLAGDPQWERWNACRGTARAPGGESMGEAQARIIGHIEEQRRARPDIRAVLVSHCDVIRAALLHFLTLPLDAYDRIEVAPGSISTVIVGDWGSRILSLNERPAP